MLSVFFFQAEDGIRDYKVTGVQTCALPIYGANHASTESTIAGTNHAGASVATGSARHASPLAARAKHAASTAVASHPERSEERRVGKEGRDRWEGEH